MITQKSRLATGQTFLTMALHHAATGLLASLKEVPESQLREWSGANDATQFFATQVSLVFVIENYLSSGPLREAMESLIDIPDEYEDDDEDSFSLDVESAIGESDSEKKNQLLEYDLGPQMIHIAGEFIRRHGEHMSSPFTPGLFQGESHGSLEEILSGLKKTVSFVKENWPKRVVSTVLDHAIGDYEAANSFLTPFGYLESLRGRKKVSPRIDKRHVGTIPFGIFQHVPPLGAALSRKMHYMAPIHMILSSIQGAMSAMGIVDEMSLREFEELKDGLIESAMKIDTFIQERAQ